MNANSSSVSGWENDLTNAGGANIVAGQANVVRNNAGKSVALGWKNNIGNHNQFALGVGIDLTQEYSGGFGVDIAANGNRSFVIGNGSNGVSKLVNNIPYSIMFGTSNTPTMLINNQSVGINLGTSTPTATLHNRGTVRFQDLPSGSGNVLVIDANGNIFKSTSLAKSTAIEDTKIQNMQTKIDDLNNEVKELKELITKILNKPRIRNRKKVYFSIRKSYCVAVEKNKV